MGRTCAFVVFLLLAHEGRAQFQTPAAGFGIISHSTDVFDSSAGSTISVAALRHKLVRKAVAAFTRAAKFAKAGSWQMGALELQKAIAIDPEFSEAHGNLGAHYVRLGRTADGVKEFRRAIALDPAVGIFHANLAVGMLILKRTDEAESEARAAVALDRADFKAHFILGIILARNPAGQEDAIVHLAYAARQLPEASLALAEVYKANGEFQLANQERDRYHADFAKQTPAKYGLR